MKVIVTCGPSYEPVDQVRRLTNFSTGRLGFALARHLSQAGHQVVWFRAEQATHPGTVESARQQSFSTNQDLAIRLQQLGRGETFDAVFHAAALCDYRVAKVTRPDGAPLAALKLPSDAGGLILTLEPAPKILPRLREWFPDARIVGWKYEVAGTAAAAFARAWNQIAQCRTDACVLNGAAYGPGFALCHARDRVEHWPGLGELCAGLLSWLEEGGQASPGATGT